MKNDVLSNHISKMIRLFKNHRTLMIFSVLPLLPSSLHPYPVIFSPRSLLSFFLFLLSSSFLLSHPLCLSFYPFLFYHPVFLSFVLSDSFFSTFFLSPVFCSFRLCRFLFLSFSLSNSLFSVSLILSRLPYFLSSSLSPFAYSSSSNFLFPSNFLRH